MCSLDFQLGLTVLFVYEEKLDENLNSSFCFGNHVISLVFLQVSVAGYTAGQRAKHVPRGKYVAGVSILAGTAVTMLLLVLLNVFPFTPRYIIPVAGMMVGNAMTVTGVAMKRLRDDIKIQLTLVGYMV
jgi:putative ABC transport system permease protein